MDKTKRILDRIGSVPSSPENAPRPAPSPAIVIHNHGTLIIQAPQTPQKTPGEEPET